MLPSPRRRGAAADGSSLVAFPSCTDPSTSRRHQPRNGLKKRTRWEAGVPPPGQKGGGAGGGVARHPCPPERERGLSLRPRFSTTLCRFCARGEAVGGP